MQQYRFKFFLFVLVAATIYAACRKTDSQAEKPVSVNQQSRFFDSHRSADPLEKALVSFIKNQNDKKGFVDKVIKQIGYPYWNKAITVNKPVQIGLESTDTTITYIPFVRDSQNYVNASLLIATTGGDTLMGYVCDWQYANMTFGGTQADSSAENLASFFMFFTKQTLGISKFKITDSALFASHPVYTAKTNWNLHF
jgi:hypothetical protein